MDENARRKWESIYAKKLLSEIPEKQISEHKGDADSLSVTPNAGFDRTPSSATIPSASALINSPDSESSPCIENPPGTDISEIERRPVLKPCRALDDYSEWLPVDGVALDLAAGMSDDALWLANRGLITHAWDIASNALDALQQRAGESGVSVTTKVCDISETPPEPNSFDVIVVSRFLDRSICNAISRALRPGGMLFYQTFAKGSSVGPRNPDFVLGQNELLGLFDNLIVRAYRDESVVIFRSLEPDLASDLEPGRCRESILVAEKPSSTFVEDDNGTHISHLTPDNKS